MKESVITEKTIRRLVDGFYDKARVDPALGPVFAAAIGQSDTQWQPHLQKMYNFWSSIMLTSGSYHGNPLQKHKALPSFDIGLFDRWLELFIQTAQEIHTADIAALYVRKSQRIAESLKLGIYYTPGDFPVVQPGTNP